MTETLRILAVEDVATDAELALRELKRAGLKCSVRRVETEGDFHRELAEFQPQVILSDFSMPHFDGMAALAIALESYPDIPFIFVSGTIGEEYAIRALKNGATDYVLKNNLIRLPVTVERAVRDAKERAARYKAEADLEEARTRLQSIMSKLQDVIWSVDIASGEMLYVSPAIESICKRPAAEFHQNLALWLEMVHPDDRERVKGEWEAAKRDGVFDSRYRIVLPGGGVRWIHNRAHDVRDPATNAIRRDGIARDITGLHEREQRIAYLSRIRAVLSGINSAIVRIRDRQELFNEACRIAVDHGNFGIAWIGTFDPEKLEITPVASAGLEGIQDLKDSRLLTRTSVSEGRGVAARAIQEKRPVFSNDITADPGVGGERRREAIRRGYRSTIVLPLMEQGAVAGIFSMFAKEVDFFDDEELKLLTELAGDISFALEHIGKEEKLNYLAYYDALTGLPNRALFLERLGQQLRAAEQNGTKVALILSDVKRLRFINESLGRHAGDALLRQLAARLRRIWPDPDNVARIAADCFAAILPDPKDEAGIAHVLENLVTQELSLPFRVAESDLAIAMVGGIAVFPADGRDADTLFRNVEAALNEAKASGERYLFYQPEMNARVAETLVLENKLRRALEKEQFVLHYQPKIDLATRTISGLEALIRWNDPETGLVPPMQFIPLLEETGMILEVGRWAIHKALQDYSGWYTQGLQPPHIAVNVSPIQLRQKDFVDVVRNAIREFTADPHGLDLEITESLIMDDIEGNIEKLREIKDMGVNVAIDDFGTGYSCLGYLAKLPVNALKIDRSFIITMTRNADSMTIVATIISLAHSLSLKVIAEGVDTEEQSKYLKLLKCDEIQGYLISRPLPADDLVRLLGERRSS